MNRRVGPLLCLLGFLISLALTGLPRLVAEDTVSIPKSRLEQLEKSAAEADGLRRALLAAQEEIARLKGRATAAEKALAEHPAPAAPKRAVPPLATVPSLKSGDRVSAADVLGHFRENPAGAEAVYRKRRLIFTGEIARFEKPLLVSYFHLMVKGDDARDRIVFQVEPPERFKTAYPAANGERVEGLLPNGARVPFLRLDQRVEIEGVCKGLKDGALVIDDCTMLKVQ